MHLFFNEAADTVTKNLQAYSRNEFISIFGAFMSSGFLASPDSEKMTEDFEKEL